MLQRRLIRPDEAAVVRAALERAPTQPISPEMLAQIDSLRVAGRCDCGCDSIQFAVPENTPQAFPIADAVATTSNGGRVGVLVLATGHAIKELEIYDLGAGEDDLRLPMVDSISAWDRQSGA